MKRKIIYFGGFNSTQESTKYKLFKEKFANSFTEIELISPEFNNFENIKLKLEQESKTKKLFFLSSSLGCIMGIYFAGLYKNSIAVINPSYFPEETLKDKLSKSDYEVINHIKSFHFNDKYIFVYRSKDEVVNDVLFEKFKEDLKDNIFNIKVDDFGDHSYIENLSVKYRYLQLEYSIFHNQIIEDGYSCEVI